MMCVFITAVPSTNLFAWGEGDSGGGPGTREEPGTLKQGAPVFPGSSRLEIEFKTPGLLVEDPTTGTNPSGDLIPTIRGSGLGDHPSPRYVFITTVPCVFQSQCIARHTEELHEVQGNIKHGHASSPLSAWSRFEPSLA